MAVDQSIVLQSCVISLLDIPRGNLKYTYFKKHVGMDL